MVKMLTVLVSTYLVHRYCAEKKCKSYSHCSAKKISTYGINNYQSFNDTLKNDIVSFKQLSPANQTNTDSGRRNAS